MSTELLQLIDMATAFCDGYDDELGCDYIPDLTESDEAYMDFCRDYAEDLAAQACSQ